MLPADIAIFLFILRYDLFSLALIKINSDGDKQQPDENFFFK
jgi:hypothetical protein